MKKMFAALALVTLAASPAFAATKHRTGSDAMASTASQNAYQSDSGYAFGSNGTDPDPFVRQSLQREPQPSQIGNN
jgi:hypothetical protein